MSRSLHESDSWWRKLGWLILIWAVGVVALGVVAGGIRLLMHAAGLVSG
jgi:hypothetical protein